MFIPEKICSINFNSEENVFQFNKENFYPSQTADSVKSPHFFPRYLPQPFDSQGWARSSKFVQDNSRSSPKQNSSSMSRSDSQPLFYTNIKNGPNPVSLSAENHGYSSSNSYGGKILSNRSNNERSRVVPYSISKQNFYNNNSRR